MEHYEDLRPLAGPPELVEIFDDSKFFQPCSGPGVRTCKLLGGVQSRIVATQSPLLHASIFTVHSLLTDSTRL